ncbi:MAG: 6-phosphofructokinase, partial [Lachnospiraceae bacterium]|nr:6-phosphofructokinase [Lachnospiraceae bacterium]
ICQLTAGSESVDAFGHIQMTGTAAFLANYIHDELGCKTRAVEFSTLQRAAAHLASRIDINEAFMVGGAAVKAADEGISGVMVVIDRLSDDPYQSTTGVYDVHRIANDEKLVPRNWINKEGNYVTDEFIDYVRPLIQGDYQPMMVGGLPRHLTMNSKGYKDLYNADK